MVKFAFRKLLAGGCVLAACVSPAVSQQFQPEMTKLNLIWQRLMSAVAIKTSQTANSGNQVGSTALKAAEANATAISQFEVRYAVSEAANKYGLGRDQNNTACAPVELRLMAQEAEQRNKDVKSVIADADQAFLANNGDAVDVQATLTRRRAEFYCSGEEFDGGLCAAFAGVGYNTGAKAGDTNASVWMNGGAAGAEEVATGLDFLDRVAPLPTVVAKTGAESAISRIIALRQASERSMAREIISDTIMEGLQ